MLYIIWRLAFQRYDPGVADRGTGGDHKCAEGPALRLEEKLFMPFLDALSADGTVSGFLSTPVVLP